MEFESGVGSERYECQTVNCVAVHSPLTETIDNRTGKTRSGWRTTNQRDSGRCRHRRWELTLRLVDVNERHQQDIPS